MMLGLYVFDGVQYIRIDRIEAIEETLETRKTNRYDPDGGTLVEEATRHVTTLSGAHFSSPGTAEDFLTLCEEVTQAYTRKMDEAVKREAEEAEAAAMKPPRPAGPRTRRAE